LIDQVERQRLAQPQPDHLVEPGLADVEHQKRSGDHRKYDKLMQEVRHVASRQRIVEGLVPSVEQNLPDRGRDDDGDDADRDPGERPAHRRGFQPQPDRRHLVGEAACLHRDGGFLQAWLFIGLVVHKGYSWFPRRS